MEDPGFRIVEGVVPPGDCETFLSALASSGIPRSRAGARHLMTHPAVRSLVYRTELREIARGIVGPGACPYRATLFDKSSAHNWSVVWHQDTSLPVFGRTASPDWGPWSTKGLRTYVHAPTSALEGIVALRIHLDASTASNGPLRVIPGSHRFGVLSDEEVFRKARELPAVNCIAGRGAVMVMRPLLIHASSKATGSAPRRVLHVEYAGSIGLLPGLQLAID